MSRIADKTTKILTPYVGAAIAGVCVRAGVAATGKSEDAIVAEDMDAYFDAIKQVLHPIAPEDTVKKWLAEIERRAR